MPSRSPCGERGLKYVAYEDSDPDDVSLPVRGAWIEMIFARSQRDCASASLPVRGAWIEIVQQCLSDTPPFVAPRAGSVD